MTGVYDSARSGAVFINRSDRVRIEFSGAQAAATLNGLLTNDVAKLTPGHGLYAAALTNKGKVVADLRVFARADGFIVDASAAATPGLLAMLKKYVNPRLAKYRDVSAEVGTIGVFGPDAARIVAASASVGADALGSLELFGHATTGEGAAAITIARVPDLGVTGFDIFAPRGSIADLMARLASAGATPMDAAGAHLLRVEAGRPLWGADMDENTLAQEAALDRADLNAISFDKGCYTGQETVARVHFRGHVNRILRGVRLSSAAPSGAQLVGTDGASVGDLRSVAESPRFGSIALAYVRRTVEDGTTLTARWDGGEATATVVPLPFA